MDMPARIRSLGIVPGYKCGFACAHCAVGKPELPDLSDRELALLAGTIEKFQIRSITFIGGEPTLYVDTINDLLGRLPGLGATSVSIGTNGQFATTPGAAVACLRSFRKLDKLKFSYDKFHKEFLPAGNIKNLFSACKTLSIPLTAVLTIESPLDLALIRELRDIGDNKIEVQKVLPTGSARRNKIDYVYPEFDKGVFDKFCPNRRKLVYLSGRGFTACCSSLVFNSRRTDQFVHPTLEEHLQSGFYKSITSYKFSELFRRNGVRRKGLLPRHSSPCTLCELLYKRTGVAAAEAAEGTE